MGYLWWSVSSRRRYWPKLEASDGKDCQRRHCGDFIVNFGLEALDISIPHNVQAGVVSLLLSLALFISISFGTRPRALDPEVETIMDIWYNARRPYVPVGNRVGWFLGAWK